jgi:hypothetical protein
MPEPSNEKLAEVFQAAFAAVWKPDKNGVGNLFEANEAGRRAVYEFGKRNGKDENG